MILLLDNRDPFTFNLAHALEALGAVVEVARALNNLANAVGDLGDTKRKKELLEEALEVFEKHYVAGPNQVQYHRPSMRARI